MRYLILFLSAGSFLACGGAPKSKPSVVDAVTSPPLPDWTDKYAATNTGDMRYFNMSRLMAPPHGLSRLQAVEAQIP